jgi:hypothetical protein
MTVIEGGKGTVVEQSLTEHECDVMFNLRVLVLIEVLQQAVAITSPSRAQ